MWSRSIALRRCRRSTVRPRTTTIPLPTVPKDTLSEYSLSLLHNGRRSMSGSTRKTTPSPAEENLAKAERLYEKLDGFMNDHHARLQNERQQTFGSASSWRAYFQSSGPQLINVAASMVCVVLATQVVKLRQQKTKLEKELEEQVNAISEKEALLQSLVETDFVERIVDKCVEESSVDGKEKETGGVWSWFGESESTVEDKDDTVLVQVSAGSTKRLLVKELQNRIGNAGLSKDRLDKKGLQQLRKKTGSGNVDGDAEKLVQGALTTAANGKVDEILPMDEPEVTIDSTGNAVVKRRVFSI